MAEMAYPPFSLLDTAWLPVRRRSGAREVIRPADITSSHADDPVVTPAWPRADLDANTCEFLIALLSTTCPFEEFEDWEEWWRQPPSPDELNARFASVAEALILDGDGPRFLQEFGPLASEPNPVSGLLIDSPGANTERLNLDLFQKRGQVKALSRAAAAMVLFTLQNSAPAGGAGHRTSLRGGGPLTTLAAPGGDRPTLWRIAWLNVVRNWTDEDGAPQDDPARVFPWLAATRTSEAGKSAVTPADAHPAQAFWGMPRRIRLDFEPNTEGTACDITGEVDAFIVRTYRTRPYGVNYQAQAWEHPLSPYYRPKAAEPTWLPVHPQPGGIVYRHWIEFVQGDNPLRRPARCVQAAKNRLRSLAEADLGGARLLAFGYDMDNMKARGFVEVEKPLILARNDKALGRIEGLAQRMVAAAVEAASLASGAVRAALHSEDASVDASATPFASLRETFFLETESEFFTRLHRAAETFEAAPDDESAALQFGQDWLRQILRPTAFRLFDAAVPIAAFGDADLKPIIAARQNLSLALNGYGARGKTLFAALGLRPPEQGKSRPRKTESPHVRARQSL